MVIPRYFRLLCLALVASLVTIACAFPAPQRASEANSPAASSIALTVSAAASLQTALTDLQAIYAETQPDIRLSYNFGSSGSLQQQIEQGAPVDLFISAAPTQMNALETKGLLRNETRRDLLTNQVVLIAPKADTALKDFQGLTDRAIERIAIGDPASVPAGKYAQEVFASLGLTADVQPKLILGKDVRQVLSYVETGNVDAGIVYTTDAKVSDRVRAVATAPPQSHSPIVYPIAVLQQSEQPEAAIAFAQFLSSDRAQTVFKQYGFAIAPSNS